MAGFRLERSLPPRDGWTVWEATQLALDRTVVLELLPAPADADPGWADAVLEEVRSSIGQDERTVYAAGAVPEGVYVARQAGGSPRRRLSRTVVGAAVLAVGVLLVAGVSRLDRPPAPPPAAEAPPPPRPANTVALGASLEPAATRTEDCTGLPPAAGSPDCSLAPLALTVPRDGLVRGWAVRGAQGDLALQVLRELPDGTYKEIRRAQARTVPDGGPHAFAAELPARRGDRLGLIVTSGAGVGVRRGAGHAMRWTGPLTLITGARRRGTLLRNHEVQLRVDLAPGARRPARPAVPSGRGRLIETEEVEPPGGRAGRLSVIALPQAIVVDARVGGRDTRLLVPEADPAGELVDLEQYVAEVIIVRLRWRNPRDPRHVEHNYLVYGDRVRLAE